MHGEKGGRQGGWCEGFSMEKKRWDADSHDPLILTTKSWLFEGNPLSLSHVLNIPYPLLQRCPRVGHQ